MNQTVNTATPMTDKALLAGVGYKFPRNPTKMRLAVVTDLARRLERDRAALIAALETVRADSGFFKLSDVAIERVCLALTPSKAEA